MSYFASSDATLTLSEGAVVAAVLRSVGGLAAALLSGGWYFFSTRLLCILCAIYCSNNWVCSTSLGMIVGRFAPKQCLIGCDKGGKKSQVER